MAENGVAQGVALAIGPERRFGAGTEDRPIAQNDAAGAQARLEIFERRKSGLVQCHVEMHEGPGRLRQRREHCRYPARVHGRCGKLRGEYGAHVGFGSVRLARLKEFRHLQITVGTAHRDEILGDIAAGAGEAVDQMHPLAVE